MTMTMTQLEKSKLEEEEVVSYILSLLSIQSALTFRFYIHT